MKFKKVFYLGPKGSYSDFVKSKFSELYSEDCEFVEKNSIYKIVESIISSDSIDEVAILPIENSIEGIVRETQDRLITLSEHNIKIFAEKTLLVEHSLIGYAKNIKDVKTIISHPQALAQCREFIFNNLPDDIKQKASFSTSAAVESLSESNDSVAAIGNKFCANLYGVPIIKENINDEKNNTTRFILLSRQKPDKVENNKVSICFSTENKSGALNRVLSVFEKYNINLSYIDSRPSKKELGEYIFYADFTGHVLDNNVSLALVELQSSVKMLEVLSEGALC